MIELTLDPGIVIMARSPSGVVYQRVSSGEAWSVVGNCNRCGLCVVGAAHAAHYAWHGEPGAPFAVTDLRVAAGRLDEPVGPGFMDAMRRMAAAIGLASNPCSLTVEAA